MPSNPIWNPLCSALFTVADETFVERACAAYPDLHLAALDRKTMADIANEHSIDLGTALFYARVCESPAQRHFLQFIATKQVRSSNLDSDAIRLLIVPAALYREFPNYRGDGGDFTSAAERLGIPCSVIAVGSTCGVAENACIIAREIASAEEPHVIVATLSKGGADMRIAFESGLIPAGRVKAWIQVGGVLRGTPLADDVLHGNWLRRAFIHSFLRLRGGNRAMVADLSYERTAMLFAEPESPPGVQVINIVGFPMRAHLNGSSSRRHARLSRFGPNDAMVLLADAMMHPGLICPVWGANHFFQVPGLSHILDGCLTYALSDIAHPSLLPTSLIGVNNSYPLPEMTQTI